MGKSRYKITGGKKNGFASFPKTLVEAIFWDKKKQPLEEVLDGKIDQPLDPAYVGKVPQVAQDGSVDWVVPLAGSTADSAMSDDSTNAPQNKIVKAYVDTVDGKVSQLGRVEVGDLQDVTKNEKETEEDGVFVIDAAGNILAQFLPVGIFDVSGIGPKLAAIIRDMIAPLDDETNFRIKIKLTAEGGLYITDPDGNVGGAFMDGEWVTIKGGDQVQSLVARANNAIQLGRKLQNQIDNSIPYLLPIEKSSSHTSKTITIPSIGARKKAMVKVGLHYGAEQGTPNANEIFWGGDCEKDFSDIRFFDANGKILKAQFGPAVNLEPVFDSGLNKALKVLSDGTLVGYNKGLYLSSDAGATWSLIPGTDTATPNVSQDNLRAYMYPIFVDSHDNIYAYRGGILYKLLASDSYATISPVLDFSWEDNGVTIYPDIQNHAMDEDRNGVLFVGPYQHQYHTSIFRSTDGGNTFSLCWASWTGAEQAEYDGYAQHTHHIHADPYTDDVYVGVDDGASFWNGSIILKTSDGGVTWTDITKTNHAVRGRDYYPTYFFADGYKLGGGEVFVLGGSTIIRSNNDVTYEHPMLGYGGVRSFGDFGDDSLVVCGVSRNDFFCTNELLFSRDKGKTWECFFKDDHIPAVSPGSGFRDALSSILSGETEPCVLFLTSAGAGYNGMKLYSGGNHYYREAYILLEDVADAPIVITAKNNYIMPYPFDTLEGGIESPKYRIPLNEGCGRSIKDSENNVANILVPYYWDDSEPVRFSDYNGSVAKHGFDFSAAIKLDGKVNFGAIAALPYNKNYTICFWLNEKARRLDNPPADRFSGTSDGKTFKILGFAGLDIYAANGNIGLMLPQYSGFQDSNRCIVTGFVAMMFSDTYNFIAIVVGEGTISASLNGTELRNAPASGNTLGSAINTYKVSEKDFYLGSDNAPMDGYISDVQVYGKALTEDEINAIYKGYFNYKNQ